MNVRLNETGQHRAAGCIDRLISIRANPIANFSNASFANKQISTNDGVVLIHRHNRPALDENRLAHFGNQTARIMRGSVKVCKESTLGLMSDRKSLTGKEGWLAPPDSEMKIRKMFSPCFTFHCQRG